MALGLELEITDFDRKETFMGMGMGEIFVVRHLRNIGGFIGSFFAAVRSPLHDSPVSGTAFKGK